MAKTFSGSLSVSLSGTYTDGDANNPNDPSQSILAALRGSIATGTGANQMDRVLAKEGTITSAGTATIDMAGAPSDDDGFGDDFAPVKLKLAIVHNKSTSVGSLIVNSATNANAILDPGPTIPPGGFVVVYNPAAAGYAVTGAATDEFKLEASGGDCNYELWLGGVSA